MDGPWISTATPGAKVTRVKEGLQEFPPQNVKSPPQNDCSPAEGMWAEELLVTYQPGQNGQGGQMSPLLSEDWVERAVVEQHAPLGQQGPSGQHGARFTAVWAAVAQQAPSGQQGPSGQQDALAEVLTEAESLTWTALFDRAKAKTVPAATRPSTTAVQAMSLVRIGILPYEWWNQPFPVIGTNSETATAAQRTRLTPGCLTQPDAQGDVKSRWRRMGN
jgi:hypothetical protein